VEDHSPAGQRELAREGLLELGYGPLEAEQLLADAQGDSAEALIAEALRLARTGA
jgi:Holliday junction resolvasome RuvABC DNA-binding subunit